LKKIVRAGVIGVGSMGKNHARLYSEFPDVELVGVADANLELVQNIATQYNTQYFTDYKELLRQNLDLVSVVVPTSFHHEVTIAAAQAGVNVLVEKPIARTIENASTMIETCAKKGVKLMVGHVERFNPIFPVIKSRISKLNIISIDISRLGPFPPRIRDVGVVVDLATHDIDILRFLTDSEFHKVLSLIGSGLVPDREDTALLSFEMDNGILCHINTNWLTPFKVREVNIAAKEKYIKGWLIDRKISEFETLNNGDYIVREIPVPYGEPLQLELRAFVKSVSENIKPPVTGEDGLAALKVALQCLNGGK
jgi:UDP-N-acetylglucosamine 3-dehydrogenase